MIPPPEGFDPDGFGGGNMEPKTNPAQAHSKRIDPGNPADYSAKPESLR
jgi:hypothetical protein